MRIVLDIETNKLFNPDIVHVVVVKDIDTLEVREFFEPRELEIYCHNVTLVVGHNIIGFDLIHLASLWGITFPQARIIDTLILSRLLKYRYDGGHSLEAWGVRLGFPKGNIDNFDDLTLAMIEYCIQDVELNYKLYIFLMDTARLGKDCFKRAIEVEHQIAFICRDMHRDGFKFDISNALSLTKELQERVGIIDAELKAIWGDDFNANSPKQIVTKLNEAGWKPVNKTNGHIAFIKLRYPKEQEDREKFKKKRQVYKTVGWKVDEVNLATLPEDAPEASRKLTERLLLMGRIRTLEQWLKAYRPLTGSIHGIFDGIGTWTHRMAHREPNMGNVAAVKSIKYKSPELFAEAVKLGREMRALWIVESDEWLVGTDAEGIQLRIFAHLINDPEFTRSVTYGNKDDGTDPHTLNKVALQPYCKTRDDAKTFIYAFLLGAGNGKIAEILGVPLDDGNRAREAFIERYPGLAKLKQERIPEDAKRGYFEGFDGRLVPCDSEHLMLAGYLQNGEACIMKHANVLWRQQLDELEIKARQVNFIHDEWQTAVRGERSAAELVGRTQSDSIKRVGELFELQCPLAGTYRVGRDWYQTH